MFKILSNQTNKNPSIIQISQKTIAEDKTGNWSCIVTRYNGFNTNKTAGLMVQMKYRKLNSVRK